ncbi:hypothetical protein [Profundibacter sp.]
MRYNDLADFLNRGKQALAKGPVALILVEDAIEVDSTIQHHLQLGFKSVLVFAAEGMEPTPENEDNIHLIPYDMSADNAMTTAVNSIIKAAPGIWLYYCFNAEYLFYPFCESRTVGEMVAFHTEERRASILTYAIDLYANDLNQSPDAVSLENAHLDKSGYYALAREDAANNYQPKDRQLDFYGGLRWRFEEHIPWERRKIDRIALFRAKKGLELRPDHTFNDEEYNTYSCEWHHNITVAICSFRVAKALKHNPGSTYDIETFRWHNSVKFEWNSRQLMDLGLMEPGQWF